MDTEDTIIAMVDDNEHPFDVPSSVRHALIIVHTSIRSWRRRAVDDDDDGDDDDGNFHDDGDYVDGDDEEYDDADSFRSLLLKASPADNRKVCVYLCVPACT